MSRNAYSTVTVEILIPTSTKTTDGEVFPSHLSMIKVRRFQMRPRDLELLDKSDRELITDSIALEQALADDRRSAIEQTAPKLAGSLLSRMITAAQVRADPRYAETVFMGKLSYELRDTQLVLWRHDGEIKPALLCPDVKSAFLVRTLLSVAGLSTGLRLCPKCGIPFLQRQSNQDYCKASHREAHRVQRFRAKKRSSAPKSLQKAGPGRGSR